MANKHVHRHGYGGSHRRRCEGIMETIFDIVSEALVEEREVDIERLVKAHDDLASTMDHWKNDWPLFRWTINGGD